MTGQRRVFFLIMIMVAVAVIVSGTTLAILYNTSLNQQRDRLTEMAQSQARLIESMERYHLQYTNSGPEAFELTLNELREAHEHFRGFGETGEFTLAQWEDSQIVFLLSHRHYDLDNPEPVPHDSELAEPMRQALLGRSGTIIALDYRGEKVLAAHEPVEGLGLGIVAKIDMKEIQAPFIRAGLITGLTGAVIILLGAVLFIQVTNPLLASLEQNEVKYRTLFEYAYDAIFVVDPVTLRFLEVNQKAAENLGYSRQELLHLGLQDIYSKEDTERNQALLKELLAEDSLTFEHTQRRKDGSLLPVEVCSRIVEYSGQLVIQSQVRDITQRKQAEAEIQRLNQGLEQRVAERTADLKAANEELRSLSQVKAEFVSNISHELRTPLTTIKLYLELLERSEGKQEHHMETLKRETRRLETIVENLLYVSRLDQEKTPLRLRPENINELVSSYVMDRMPLARSKNLNLSLELMPDLPPVQLDKEQLGQVIGALLTNAINYTPAENRISVLTHTAEFQGKKWAGFSVNNIGTGIPSEEQAKIFTRFYRGQAGQESGLPGTGLGLAIAKEIVERHQGVITVESGTTVDQGTTFYVWLRLTDETVTEFSGNGQLY